MLHTFEYITNDDIVNPRALFACERNVTSVINSLSLCFQRSFSLVGVVMHFYCFFTFVSGSARGRTLSFVMSGRALCLKEAKRTDNPHQRNHLEWVAQRTQ